MRRESRICVSVAIFLLATAVPLKVALVSAVRQNNDTNMTSGCRHSPGFLSAEVDFEELKKLLADPHNFVLDVREAQEVEQDGALRGSVNLPLSSLEKVSGSAADFEKAIGRLIDPSGRNVILSCRSGRRAFIAFDKLKHLGYNEMKVYGGSYLDWKANGGEIVRSKP